MIQYLYLGRVDYDEALSLQAELVSLRLQGRIGNLLLLLEHPPVLTLGRNAHRSNILASDQLLSSRGFTIHDINRGGDVTYHGPGQLVGYPIFDLRSLPNAKGGRLGPVDFVRMTEEALIRLCAVYSVPAGRIPGLTGVWCAPQGKAWDESCAKTAKDTPAGERKIAAIGIHVSRGITSHGFALNVTTNLRDFDLIIPCGIADHSVTSLKVELEGRAATQPVVTLANDLTNLEVVAHQAARQFGLVFSQQVLAVESLDVLRAQAASSPVLPAEDTPLQIPAEIERLLHKQDIPRRA
jgi:lipoyl(octanoyl) transferase